MSPNLPDELVAKILVKGSLYTQKRKFAEIATTSRALHDYAHMAQKREDPVFAQANKLPLDTLYYVKFSSNPFFPPNILNTY